MSTSRERSALMIGSSSSSRDRSNQTRSYGATDVEDDACSIESARSIVCPKAKIRYFVLFVPLASVFLFGALVSAVLYAFRDAISSVPVQTLLLNWTLAPFAAAVIVWIACFANKPNIIALFQYLGLSKLFSVFGRCGNVPSIFVMNLVAELARLATLHLTRPGNSYPESYSLYTSCWVAFGWAAAEVVASTVQGYSHLTLYCEYPIEIVNPKEPGSPVQRLTSGSAEVTNSEEMHNHQQQEESQVGLSQYIDEQLFDLLNLKKMFELEAAYGCAVTEVPTILSVIQRLDSIIASFGLTLLLSSPFHHSNPTSTPSDSDSRSIALTYFAVVIIHTVLSAFWCPKILPGIGVHTAVFVACVISIGCVFAGLWRWGILV